WKETLVAGVNPTGRTDPSVGQGPPDLPRRAIASGSYSRGVTRGEREPSGMPSFSIPPIGGDRRGGRRGAPPSPGRNVLRLTNRLSAARPPALYQVLECSYTLEQADRARASSGSDTGS